MDTGDKSVTAVIVAAGQGKRLGEEMPKAFIDLGGRPMFMHSVLAFAAHAEVESIVIVVPAEMMQQAQKQVGVQKPGKPVAIVAGGQHRWQSVKNGVEKAAAPWILVHDAARPFIDSATIDAILQKREKYACAIIGTRCADTVRTFDGDRCVATIDRNTLVRVGTPQVFDRKKLLAAFDKAQGMEPPPTDEAMLMEMCGEAVGLAWGNPLNFKITTAADLELARALAAKQQRSS